MCFNHSNFAENDNPYRCSMVFPEPRDCKRIHWPARNSSWKSNLLDVTWCSQSTLKGSFRVRKLTAAALADRRSCVQPQHLVLEISYEGAFSQTVSTLGPCKTQIQHEIGERCPAAKTDGFHSDRDNIIILDFPNKVKLGPCRSL